MRRQDRSLQYSSFLLSISTWFLLFHVVVSQIPLGSKLSVVQNNTWMSYNGDFAIGFFTTSDQPNQYSVGIRFSSELIPAHKKTVVWVAGADVVVSENSYFELSSNGELVLVDTSRGITLWSSNTSQLLVVSGLLRNDGNLVLLNSESDVVWQSFDNPLDTLLPGQNLPVAKTLRAASRNSVSSYYSLHMNSSGQLQLKWESNVIYWNSEIPASSFNVSAVLTSQGALQIVRQENLEPVWSVFSEDHNENVSSRFLRLDVDGNLRIYSWNEALQSWKAVWQAVDNQCEVFATCGDHGICVFNASGSPECQCPFSTTNSVPNWKCFEQNCVKGSTLVVYEHTFLYGVYPPSDSVTYTSLQQCRNSCLKNPGCIAATFTNDGTSECKIKTTPYFSGYSDPSLSSVSFVRTCQDPLAVNPDSRTIRSPNKRSFGLCIPCLVGAVSFTSVVFLSVQLAIVCFVYRKRNRIIRKGSLAYSKRNSKGLMTLTFSEIKDITGNFKHRIGPNIYRGMLPNHRQVAIKDLDTIVEERKFRGFVSKICSISHKNLVKVEGYCCESDHRFLVYEYVKNGSVEKYLVDDELCRVLTWRRRLNICTTVAKALCYLHGACREFVSHGNLKCENVVLDKNYEAKLSEFGLRFVHAETSQTAERDVEDFGKMLLVLITGCIKLDEIIEWVYEELMQGRPETLLDKRINGDEDEVNVEELERALRIGFWCLQMDERMRPSMSEVAKVLEGTLTVDPPPCPFTNLTLPEGDESPETSVDRRA